MNNYKFRGKTADDKWVYGDLHILNTKTPHIHTDESFNGLMKSYKIIPETVGQGTGLLDKNKKEIYHGDICRAMIEDREVIFTVTWFAGAFYGISKEHQPEYGEHKLLSCFNNIEVVGNVHDNPELLEVK